MRSTRVTTILSYGILSLAVIFSFWLPDSLLPTSKGLFQAPPDVMNLSGVIYDFKSDHPDFGNIDVADLGHYVGNVSSVLGEMRRPEFANAGLEVTAEWHDKDGNPIAPYAGPGLAFGHFDVDVYDEISKKREFHEHEYDDEYDVVYVDVVNNPWLEGNDFDSLIGGGYPNNLRVEFVNVHNGGAGTYEFDAGSEVQSGDIDDGFTTTFDPALLTQLRVTFVSLAYMRHTAPRPVKDDPINRDEAFHIRMYDVVTDEMVYEITLYHHGDLDDFAVAKPPKQDDSCGDAIEDEVGEYGDLGDTGITDAETFAQWFTDILGTNLPTRHTISLERDDDGVYEYITNEFYPIDDRLLGNDGDSHNNYFTYMFAASFTYDECTEQFFEFASNDDAWVYINGNLVIDIGGAATLERQYVNLDRLGLVDGQTYTLEFFFAHRRNVLDSLFHMRTNIMLDTAELGSLLGFYD